MAVAWIMLALFSAANQPRFDHAKHEAAILEKKGTNPDCNECHKLDASSEWAQKLPVGKTGGVHTPCSNDGCHHDAYARFKKRELDFCFTCHLDRLGKELVYPPYRERGWGDFYMATFDHGVHTKNGAQSCAECHLMRDETHAGERDMRRVAHARCASFECHGQKVKPVMDACSGCHFAKATSPKPVDMLATRESSNYRVRQTFSHPAHKKKSPKDVCTTCHTNSAVPKGERVQIPPMIACERCHNGTNAFFALGNECRRCHTLAEAR